MSEVVWKTLGDICNIMNGKDYKKEGDGEVPVYGSGGIMTYIDKAMSSKPSVLLPRKGSLNNVFYVDTPFWTVDTIYWTDIKDNTVPKYFYYYMTTINLEAMNIATGAVPSMTKAILNKIVIPVPKDPHRQKQIVNQLDTFTSLISHLESELELRQKQYEHYREELLSFEGDKEVEWKTLGDIGDVAMCKRIFKEQTQPQGEIPFYKIGTFGKTADAFISRELYEDFRSKYKYPKIGDILMSASGSIGRTVVYDGSDAYYQDSNIVWIENDESIVSNKFLRLIYSITKWNVDNGGVIARLYNKNIRSTIIPIPRKNRQQQIVDKLDMFEQLIAALKREIALRKKQYAYYRDKLLTFE
ncbi:MAG: restriction endonuclease subunit S [Mediterranea sp.]|nr:restriction endonuclease subunit S [Mediterranea sp.]